MMRLIPILSACTLLLASATTQAADSRQSSSLGARPGPAAR